MLVQTQTVGLNVTADAEVGDENLRRTAGMRQIACFLWPLDLYLWIHKVNRSVGQFVFCLLIIAHSFQGPRTTHCRALLIALVG